MKTRRGKVELESQPQGSAAPVTGESEAGSGKNNSSRNNIQSSDAGLAWLPES